MYAYKSTRQTPSPKTKMVQRLLQKRRSTPVSRTMFKRKRDNSCKLKEKLINYLRSELAVSTTHGLPYIVDKDMQWCERFFWTLSFIGNLALVFYLLSVQLARFIETPIVMSVEMDYFNWNFSYPAFTLCPLVKVDTNAYNSFLNESYIKTEKSLEKYLWAIVSANLEYIDTLDIDISPDIISLIDPKEYTNIAASIFKRFDLTSMTTNTNSPISVEPVMTEHGMCHVVNSNIAKFDNPVNWGNSNVMIYSKGNIELSIHDRDFFTQIMDYADIYNLFINKISTSVLGNHEENDLCWTPTAIRCEAPNVMVYIHNSDEVVLSTTSAYTHSLKGFMSIGVTLWISKISEELRHTSVRLRKCKFVNEPISKRFPIYSYNRCMLECRIQMILNICGCVPHFYKPLPNERICKVNELKCLIDYKKEIITLSASEKMLRKFGYRKGLPRNSHECGCVGLCDSVIYQKDYDHFISQSDFNRLRIGISTFPAVRVVREIIFSGYEIILKIGGAVNLCVGASIISMFEICLILIKIPIYWLVCKATEYYKRYFLHF